MKRIFSRLYVRRGISVADRGLAGVTGALGGTRCGTGQDQYQCHRLSVDDMKSMTFPLLWRLPALRQWSSGCRAQWP